MDHKLKVDLIVNKIRILILENKKTIWGLLVVFSCLVLATIGFIYYQKSVNAKYSDEFYQLLLHSKDDSDDNQFYEKVNQFVNSDQDLLNSKQTYATFLQVIALSEQVKKEPNENLDQKLVNGNFEVADPMLADLIKIKNANILIDLESFEDAKKMLSEINTKELEELQLLTLAKVYIAEKDNEKAKNTIQNLLSSYPQSPLLGIASNYLFLIN